MNPRASFRSLNTLAALTTLTAAALTAVLSGCGSGGMGSGSAGGSGLGRASIVITWPERTRVSRLIPLASNSIVVEFKQGVNVVAKQTLARPASGNQTSADFNTLPAGSLTVSATAYPETNGTGTAQAAATGPITIVAGQNTPVTLTMLSTVHHLEMFPSPAGVKVLQTVQLSATAKDSSGNIVLVAPSATTWSSASTMIATVSTTGLVTGVDAGTTQVTATDTESGKSVTGTVNVSAPDGGGGPPAHIYITDTVNNRIVRVDDMNGTGWTTVGKADLFPGSGVREFWGPSGIALDSQNRIYVLDSNNAQVVRMDDIAGSGWTRYGTFGSGVGQFAFPQGISIDSQNRIYVATGNPHFARFDDMTGAGWTQYGVLGTGTGQFVEAHGITVAPNQQLYMVDYTGARIARVDNMSGGNWVSNGGLGGGTNQFTFPTSIAVDDQDRIYVADSQNNRIVRMDNVNGQNWTTFGTKGAGVNQLDTPTNVAVSGEGKIYIVDQGNSRIVRIDDISGAGWTTFGTNGTGVGQFKRPYGIFVK